MKLPDLSGEKEFIEAPLYSGTAVAYLRAVVAAAAPAGDQQIVVFVNFQACNENTCEPEVRKHTTVSVKIAAAGDPPQATLNEPALFSGLRSVDAAAPKP